MNIVWSVAKCMHLWYIQGVDKYIHLYTQSIQQIIVSHLVWLSREGKVEKMGKTGKTVKEKAAAYDDLVDYLRFCRDYAAKCYASRDDDYPDNDYMRGFVCGDYRLIECIFEKFGDL